MWTGAYLFTVGTVMSFVACWMSFHVWIMMRMVTIVLIEFNRSVLPYWGNCNNQLATNFRITLSASFAIPAIVNIKMVHNWKKRAIPTTISMNTDR